MSEITTNAVTLALKCKHSRIMAFANSFYRVDFGVFVVNLPNHTFKLKDVPLTSSIKKNVDFGKVRFYDTSGWRKRERGIFFT